MQLSYLIQESRRRTISIQVLDDKEIIVKVPFATPRFIAEKFIMEKEGWILRQIKKIEKEESVAHSMGLLSEDDIKEIKEKAKRLIPQRVGHFAKLSGISYNRIFIRMQKTRWGSCSADGNLNFNCLLVLMPAEVLDSVVVHELCHRRHMNHSKAFYDEVLRIFPEYKIWDKWLKENGGAYLKRLGQKNT